jgi:ubiquinone/menaquinone biosynthesis C-methylase UbiE
MLDSAGVQDGTRFADLGCGGGGASILAAQRGAQVSGLDAAEALIAIARKRLAAGDFRVGDLELLPFDDDGFDVAFSSFSLMFVGDMGEALSEMKRVTSPEGRVTVGVWGDPEDCEYRHVLAAIASTLPSPPVGEGPFALSKENLLERMMEVAGLTPVARSDVSGTFRFTDSKTMLRMVGSVGPMQSARQLVSEDVLETAILQAAKPFQSDSGEFVFNNRFRYVTAIA